MAANNDQGILMHSFLTGSNFSNRCIDLLKTLSNMWMMRNTLKELAEDVTGETEGNSSYGDPNTSVTTLMDLPEHLTIEILMRLPVKSLCCIQCVSKTSLDIARSPGFATLHTLRLVDSAMNSSIVELPQLMLVTKRRCVDRMLVWQSWQSFNYNGSKQTLTKSRPVSQSCFLSNFAVDFVFCNLFFLKHGHGGPCLLVNPLRQEVLQLPISNIQGPTTNGSGDNDWYGMGFDSVTNTYKIVHVSASMKRNCVVAQVLVLGTSSWRQIHLAPPFDVSCYFSGRRIRNAIYVCGDMHWLIANNIESPGHIISFNFNREEFYVTLLPTSYGTGFDFYTSVNLFKLRGSLAFVEFHPDEDNIKIWVLKSYDEEKWELHHKIKKKMLIGCDCFRETCAEWEHGICFASPEECYFLDLRHPSMKRVELPAPELSIYGPDFWPTTFSLDFWRGRDIVCSIFSYTESLISLKNYGKLND